MGLFTGLIGLTSLRQRELDLGNKIEETMTTINQVSTYAMEIVSIGDELDPESPEFKKLTARKKKLELMEKKLNAELTRYQTQLKLVASQVKAFEGMVDNGINRFTGLMGGGGGH